MVYNFDKSQPESVHLCSFPVADESYINEKLDAGMEDVLKVVVLGRAARAKMNLKNRQPLSRLLYNGKTELDQPLKELVEDELNVKEVQLSSGEDYIDYEVKPQLKTVGPKYGALLGQIKVELANKAKEIVMAVKKVGKAVFNIQDREVELTEDDLLIAVKNKEGFSAESDGETTVVLDTKLTPELIKEGVERELVSKIQTMRKDAGFEVVDHIIIGYEAEGLAKDVLDNATFLKDVLADGIQNKVDGYTKDWNINGDKVILSVKKV